MAEIVTLNRVRKVKSRVADRSKANENAVKFGQTNAEKTLEAAKADKARRDLDAAKRE